MNSKSCQKRLQLLAGIIITLASISFVISLDGLQAQKDRRALEALSNVKYLTKFFEDNGVFENNVPENGAYYFLKEHNPTLFDENRKSREFLVKCLESHCITTESISQAKGFSNPENKRFNFNLIRLDTDSIRNIMHQHRVENTTVQEMHYQSNYFRGLEWVPAAVNLYKQLNKPIRVKVVVKVDTSNAFRLPCRSIPMVKDSLKLDSLRRKAQSDSLLKLQSSKYSDFRKRNYFGKRKRINYLADDETYGDGAGPDVFGTNSHSPTEERTDAFFASIIKRYYLQEIYLGDSIMINFGTESDSDIPFSPQQISHRFQRIALAAVTKEIEIPSITEITMGDFNNYQIPKNYLDELSKTYDDFYIDDVISRLKDAYMAKIEKFELFGLKFPRNLIPYVLSLCLLFALYFSNRSIKQLNILNEDSDFEREGISSIFLEMKMGRFILWMGLPLTSLLLCFISMSLDWLTIFLTIVMFLIIGIIGWITFRTSNFR